MNELGLDNFLIELIEEYPCESKQELRAREGHFIKELGTLNKQIAGRTCKEWLEENKHKLKEKQRIYNEINQEHIKEQKKKYQADRMFLKNFLHNLLMRKKFCFKIN